MQCPEEKNIAIQPNANKDRKKEIYDLLYKARKDVRPQGLHQIKKHASFEFCRLTALKYLINGQVFDIYSIHTLPLS